jgi:hypothetical protein
MVQLSLLEIMCWIQCVFENIISENGAYEEIVTILSIRTLYQFLDNVSDGFYLHIK